MRVLALLFVTTLLTSTAVAQEANPLPEARFTVGRTIGLHNITAGFDQGPAHRLEREGDVAIQTKVGFARRSLYREGSYMNSLASANLIWRPLVGSFELEVPAMAALTFLDQNEVGRRRILQMGVGVEGAGVRITPEICECDRLHANPELYVNAMGFLHGVQHEGKWESAITLSVHSDYALERLRFDAEYRSLYRVSDKLALGYAALLQRRLPGRSGPDVQTESWNAQASGRVTWTPQRYFHLFALGGWRAEENLLEHRPFAMVGVKLMLEVARREGPSVTPWEDSVRTLGEK